MRATDKVSLAFVTRSRCLLNALIELFTQSLLNQEMRVGKDSKLLSERSPLPPTDSHCKRGALSVGPLG